MSLPIMTAKEADKAFEKILYVEEDTTKLTKATVKSVINRKRETENCDLITIQFEQNLPEVSVIINRKFEESLSEYSFFPGQKTLGFFYTSPTRKPCAIFLTGRVVTRSPEDNEEQLISENLSSEFEKVIVD